MKRVLIFLILVFIILNLFGCSNKRLDKEFDSSLIVTPSMENTETITPTQTLSLTPTITLTPTNVQDSEDVTNATTTPSITGDQINDRVKATIKVFNGSYIDESSRGYEGVTSDTPQIYYIVKVSNVSDTSFDFAIHEMIFNKEDEEKTILTGTAYFIEDGTRAVFNENETELYFTFPYVASDLAAITMQISGLDLLEGKVFSNWSIPGHEAG